MQKNNKKNYKKGFGLLEVLLSGVIIIIILSALVFIGRAAMNSSVNTQQRAQATYLSQLNLEMVRQIRDTSWLQVVNDASGNKQTSWNSFFQAGTAGVGFTFSTSLLPATNYEVEYNSSLSRFFLLRTGGNHGLQRVTLDGKTFYLALLKDSLVPGMMPSFSNGTVSDDGPTGNTINVESKVSTNSGFSPALIDENMIFTNWKPSY